MAIAVILALAFVERPSSLSLSSDPRVRLSPWEPPCGLTEGIEMVCLAIFTLDLAVKVTTLGKTNPNQAEAVLLSESSVTLRPVLPPELSDWLGGVPEEQVAYWLHRGHLSICN